jgi:hypothetical protein
MSDWYNAIMGAGPFGGFGRQYVLPEYVPVSDPNPRSPYHIPSQHVPVEAVAEPVVELTPGERAEAFLVEQLTPDPVPTVTLQAKAKAQGISWVTVRRIMKLLGVRVFKDGRGPWMMGLKEDN